MQNRKIYVSIDISGNTIPVGTLWSHTRRGKEGASFEYDRAWLSHPLRFSIEPTLNLQEGAFHANKSMFGVLGDSAPDRWGRVLMRRAESKHAALEGRTPRTLLEIDYLLGVHDIARQGALRFSLTPNGPYLADTCKKVIPPLITLPTLLSAAERFIADKDNTDDLALLLAPGSSLGGARPKASIIDAENRLAIAKFPHKEDYFPTVQWEAVALTLAKMAGITTSKWVIKTIDGKYVLILQRFDRNGAQQRIPFMSAMSMLQAQDNETHSYLEIVDAIRRYGARPEKDIEELWRRIVFSILISNTDDHLRNHGFLYQSSGWVLSPVYDINPTPVSVKPRILSTTINMHDGSASLELALSVANEFGLSAVTANEIIYKVSTAVSTWKQCAEKFGIKNTEIKKMESAFEHADLLQALKR